MLNDSVDILLAMCLLFKCKLLFISETTKPILIKIWYASYVSKRNLIVYHLGF